MKNTAKRIVLLLICASLIGSVLLYEAGVFDVSFIERPIKLDDETTKEDETTETEKDSETVPDTDGETTVVVDTEPPDTEEPYDDGKISEMLNAIETVPASSVTPSKAIYSESSTIVRASELTLANSYSVRTLKLARNYEYTKPNQKIWIKSKTVSEKQPAVKLYFGYILVDNKTSYSIYSPSGNLLVKAFKGTLEYAKTEDGLPVVSVSKKLYTLSEEGLSAEPIEESSVIRLALKIDYPEYYANDPTDLVPYMDYKITFNLIETTAETTEEPSDTETDETVSGESTSEAESTDTGSETVTVSTEKSNASSEETSSVADSTTEPESTDTDDEEDDSEESSENTEDFPTDVTEGQIVTVNGKEYKVVFTPVWGYKNGDGEIVIEAKYKEVYSFTNDGLASVIGLDRDEVIVIDKKGNEVINSVAKEPTLSEYLATNIRTRKRHLTAVNADVSSIGMYYFDKGYCLVRYAESMQKKLNELYVTEYRLVSKSGKYFDVPGGYNVVNYSDGIILLEKDGKYGYLSIDGSWVKAAIYLEARPFLQGLAVVKASNGKYGLINTSGEYVLPNYFDYISDVSSGVVSAYSEERGWEIYFVSEPTIEEPETTNEIS